MLKTVDLLTSAAWLTALTHVANAATDEECSQALVAAATRIQDAVASFQNPESLIEALDSCPPHLASYMNAAVDRAVNFHMLDEGGTLGLWLLPVTIAREGAMPGIVSLDAGSATGSRMMLHLSSSLLKQFKVGPDDVGQGNRVGWSYVLPALYSDEVLHDADLGELVTLPTQARAAVRGERKTISFAPVAEVEPSNNTVHLYYIPMVVYHPEGSSIGLPDASEKTVQLATKLMQLSLPGLDSLSVRVAQRPQPFSVALNVGARMRSDVRLRIIMDTLIKNTGVEPNGMAALVAPYYAQNKEGQLTLGVSLISRLTKNSLATVALPVESDDGSEEAALTTHVLREMGMVCVQHNPHPIDTFACQYCGMIQFSMPNPDIASKGMDKMPTQLH